MRISKILAAFFVMLFLCVCDLGLLDKESEPEPEPEPREITLQIQGVVTDATNDSLIVGAKVILGRFTSMESSEVLTEAHTNQEGFYSLNYFWKFFIPVPPYKLLWIVAEADGYNDDFHANIDVDILGESDEYYVNLTEDVQTIHFQLEPES